MKKSKQEPLRQLKQLVTNKNSRAPFADVTNAPYLMGDADDYGDAEDGDADYGDSDYGDVDSSPLAVFDSLVGDSEVGGPRRRLSPTAKRIIGGTLGLGAGVGAGLLVNKLVRNQRNKRNAQAALTKSQRQMTIQNQMDARRAMGKLPRNSQLPFFQITGAVLNASPISAGESFVADILKSHLDRQQSDTPFEVEIVAGTFAGSTWTVIANGVATPRFYTGVVLTLGVNQLAANPGTIFSISGVLPTINGSLLISTNPFSFTLQHKYHSQFMIFPWQIVTNKPLLALGSYSSSNPISFTINGLPSNANVNLTIPGSQHTWTIAMRNRLL